MNGESILKYLSNCSIKFVEGAFCYAIDLQVNSMDLWPTFDPIDCFGELVLTVVIGDSQYKFLVEERKTTVNIPGIAFNVWGRSQQSFLDKPYSKTISDSDSENESDWLFWQKSDTTALTIINYVVQQCCSLPISVHWDIPDFLVKKGTFSTSDTTPIEVITTFTNIIGAELKANADGSLTIQEYSVTEETSIQEYNDFDHIVSLNEDIEYPIGYNCVTVNGFDESNGNSSSEKDSFLSVELISDDLPGWVEGKVRYVKIRCFHPLGSEWFRLQTEVAPAPDYPNGIVGINYFYTEQITEWVVLNFGKGNTQYPDENGNTEIFDRMNTKTPFRLQQVSYVTKCAKGFIAPYLGPAYPNRPDFGIAVFYFSDFSAIATLQFDRYVEDNTSNYKTSVEVS